MKNLKAFCYCAIILVLFASLAPEVEARRKILKGRRTITRTYNKPSLIPAWAIILLVSIGEVIAGVGIFFIMKKFILDPPLHGTYSPPPNLGGP